MNNKQIISIFAVSVMLFAGFACVLGGAGSEGTSTVETSNVSELIYIDNNGKITSNPAEFKATYDEGTHTLSFNKDISVESTTYFIASLYTGTLIIEINSNVVFTASGQSDDYGCIGLSGNATIRGTGSLTLNVPTSTDDVSGINNWEHDITIEGIDLTINSPKNCNQFVGIGCNKTVSISGASVTIDVSNPSVSNGTCGIKSTSIIVIKSHISMTVGNSKGFLLAGDVTIYDSLVEIKGTESTSVNTVGILVGDSALSNTLFVMTRTSVVMDFSKGPVQGGICVADAPITFNDCSITMVFNQSASLKDSMGINGSKGVSANNSHISIKGSIEYAFGDTNSVSTELEGCIVSFNVSGIGLLGKIVTISSSTVSIVSGGASIGGKGCIIYYSDINARSTYAFAFSNEATNVSNCDKILGSDGSVAPTEEIPTLGEYKWVHIVTSQIISFNLGEGEGTGVKPITVHVGDKIALPGCDAKSGDKVFIGWTDGYKLYQAEDKYTVVMSTTLTAVYDEPELKPSSDNTNIVLFAALCIVVIIALILMVTRPWQ